MRHMFDKTERSRLEHSGISEDCLRASTKHPGWEMGQTTYLRWSQREHAYKHAFDAGTLEGGRKALIVEIEEAIEQGLREALLYGLKKVIITFAKVARIGAQRRPNWQAVYCFR